MKVLCTACHKESEPKQKRKRARNGKTVCCNAKWVAISNGENR